ncbi:hypothetical protein [Leifsonia poae]|uniref:Uncharacterized protein n=1 Tax=Leifsonia poae TaxID=110933 RepID=A0A9W6H761_9MICO|nr:hypothetical protein [Leifsonia poae]GLJ74902.1 hypothetical protein GCM10017584_04750 [Leifsonia poae]
MTERESIEYPDEAGYPDGSGFLDEGSASGDAQAPALDDVERFAMSDEEDDEDDHDIDPGEAF